MQISMHAAQHLAYSSVLLNQITFAVVHGFQAAHGTSPADSDALVRLLDAISEALERVFVHVALLLFILAKVLAEIAKLLRRVWRACVDFGSVLRGVLPVLAAVIRAVRSAIGKLLLLTPSTLALIVLFAVAVIACVVIAVLTR